MTKAPLDLRDYLSILWARKWMILVVVATTTSVAIFYSTRQVPMYASSAEVVVRPARFDPRQPSAAAAFINMRTEEQVANSGTVADLALQRLEKDGVVPGSVSASQVPDAETIVFSSTSPEPAVAQATADAYARAYLDLRQERVSNELETARMPFEIRLEEVNRQLRRIARTLDTVTDEARRSTLTTRYSALFAERTALTSDLGELADPENVHVGDLLRSAGLPTSPFSPNHVTNGALGLLAGLALGIALAFIRDRFDDRPRGREELELQSGAPVIAFIPRFPSSKSRLITADRPSSEAAEAYKALRVRLLQITAHRDLRTMIVTSSLAGEGKTSTSANLAVAMAMVGKRVVVVSADLRQPTLQDYFPTVDGNVGLTDALAGRRPTRKSLAFSGTPDLWVLHAGSRIDSMGPLELLGSEAMSDVLAELRNFADLVIIDTPPILTSPDVAALAPLTDGALFVADPRRVQRATLDQARHELQLLGVPVLGVVVNRYNPRRFRSYGYGYGYGYGFGTGLGSPGEAAPEHVGGARLPREPRSIVQLNRVDPTRQPEAAEAEE